jgi:hypothetical protein
VYYTSVVTEGYQPSALINMTSSCSSPFNPPIPTFKTHQTP